MPRSSSERRSRTRGQYAGFVIVPLVGAQAFGRLMPGGTLRRYQSLAKITQVAQTRPAPQDPVRFECPGSSSERLSRCRGDSRVSRLFRRSMRSETLRRYQSLARITQVAQARPAPQDPVRLDQPVRSRTW